MPGKVNPVIPEVVNQVAFNIIGNDVTITMAAEAGQLELNAFEPIIFYCMFQSIDTLGYAVQTLVDNCIVGITANEERCRYLVENSVGIITAISPHLGYQKAADIAKKAIKTGESVRSLILKEKLMDEDELNRILDPIHMTVDVSSLKSAASSRYFFNSFLARYASTRTFSNVICKTAAISFCVIPPKYCI